MFYEDQRPKYLSTLAFTFMFFTNWFTLAVILSLSTLSIMFPWLRTCSNKFIASFDIYYSVLNPISPP